MAETVLINFEGKDDASDVAKRIGNNVDDLGTKATSVGGKISSFMGGIMSGVGMGAFNLAVDGIKAVGGAVMDGIGEAQEWQSSLAQTEAVIKSTGGAAGLTAQQMGDLAGELSAASGKSMFSDDAILGAQNVLATFTNIKGIQFEGATQSIVDMSQALGMDLQSASMQVGKALNDPVAGLAALSRSGVQFTKEQKDTIKAMVKSGDVAGAQAVMLKELNTQFGGSAAAAMGTYAGRQAQLTETMNDVKQTIGEALLPAMEQGTALFVDKFLPVIQQGADAFSGFMGILMSEGPSAFASLSAAGETLMASPVMTTMVGIVQGIGAAFVAIGEGFMTTAGPAFTSFQESLGRIWETLTPIGDAFAKAFGGVSTNTGSMKGLGSAIGMVIDVGLTIISTVLEPLAKVLAFILPPAFGLLALAFTNVQQVAGILGTYIVDMGNVFKKILAGDIPGAAQALVKGITKLVLGIGTFLVDAAARFTTFVADTFPGLKDEALAFVQGIIDKLPGLADDIKTAALTLGTAAMNGIINGVKAMKDALSTAFLNAISGALDAVKLFLGIKSPSILMAKEIGIPMAQGMAAGMNAGLPYVAQAGQNLAAVGTMSTVNNYYNISATYARAQSPSSIAADLRLMQIMSGGL
jgi:hypothetical protein